jgi:hypothetical protein
MIMVVGTLCNIVLGKCESAQEEEEEEKKKRRE